MIKLATVMAAEPSLSLTLMQQCGVDHVVSYGSMAPIPHASDEEQPWSHSSLAREREAFEALGLTMSVIEARPPMEKIKLGLAGRDEEIEVVCALLRNMGSAGIPVWCSMWMPILGVLRTARDIPTRGVGPTSAAMITVRCRISR